MTMVVENQNRQYGGGMGYENVYHGHHSQPGHSQFGEAWPAHTTSHPPPAPMYPTAMASNPVNIKREEAPRPAPPPPPQPPAPAAAPPPPPPPPPPSAPGAGPGPAPPALSVPYSNGPVSAPSSIVPNGHPYSTPGYSGPELMVLPADHPRTTFDQAQNGTTAPSMNPFAPQQPSYGALDYGTHQPHHHHQQQQQQHPPAHPHPPPPPHQQPPHQHQPPPQPQQQQQQHTSPGHPDARSLPPGHEPPGPVTTTQQQPPPHPPAPTYGDTLDASRGMVALSQDLAPRNMYAPQAAPRGSRESYAFPPPHSSGSSISSANNYPYYSASVVSVDSSVTDYSSTSDSYDGLQGRTLPRLSGLVAGSIPPGPQSMMGQFSSKIPSNTQKKHKCKVCDKRFTRPSSLQTHMYSHTGEKPYACDVEGCGRHFSVVSNLRRHKKVHKGEKDSGSPEEEE